MRDIKREILSINEKIKDMDPSEIIFSSNEEIYSLFRRLDQIVSMEIKKEELRDMEQDPIFQEVVKNISSFRRWFGLKLELEQTHSLLKDKNPWNKLKEFVFYPNYLKLAEMEYNGASLKKGDIVVFVGSGPLPMSLIMLAYLWDIKGIGIEKEKDYALLSTSLISHLGLEENIEIRIGDHHLIPSLNMDISLYMIASAAYPKEEIFSLLAEVLSSGSKVSYRTYEKGLRRLFCDIDTTVPQKFIEIARIHPTPPVNNTVVVLEKI